MGVVEPNIQGSGLKSSFDSRGVGFIGSSPYIDEASDSFGNLIEKIVTAAEMEATLKRLLEEIEATKRRVNALEFKVIPELEEAQGFIKLRLEEMEREERKSQADLEREERKAERERKAEIEREERKAEREEKERRDELRLSVRKKLN